MELDELKSAWSSYTARQTKSNELSAEDIEKIIEKRTVAISDKIKRNIRIGVIIMLCWVVVSFGIDFITISVTHPTERFNGMITNKMQIYAGMFEAFLYLLLFVAIIVFWHRFRNIERRQNSNQQTIRETITYLIDILSSYKRMFYIIFLVFLVYLSLMFLSGFYIGFTSSLADTGIENLHIGKVILIGGTILLFSLALLISIFYFLFTFFFKRLYGRYLNQLRGSLKELGDAEVND